MTPAARVSLGRHGTDEMATKLPIDSPITIGQVLEIADKLTDEQLAMPPAHQTGGTVGQRLALCRSQLAGLDLGSEARSGKAFDWTGRIVAELQALGAWPAIGA